MTPFQTIVHGRDGEFVGRGGTLDSKGGLGGLVKSSQRLVMVKVVEDRKKVRKKEKRKKENRQKERKKKNRKKDRKIF